jgi:hypothetical protein
VIPLLRAGIWPLMLAAAALATYLCVPETDQMSTIGLMTVGLLLIELVTRQRSAPIVIAAGAAVVLWSGLYGATGRDSAIVGAIFALWPVVIVPIVALIRPVLRARPEPVAWAIALIGAVAAVAVARTGALQPTVRPAIVAVAIVAPISLAFGLLLASWPQPQAHRGDGGTSMGGK